MAVRGPGGRFRKATQSEAASGQGGEFARLIATMQLDDEFYRAQLAKLQTDTLAAGNAIQGTLNRSTAAASAGFHGLSRAGGTVNIALRAMSFEIASSTAALNTLLGRGLGFATMLGGWKTAAVAAGAGLVALALNLGGTRDALVDSLTGWDETQRKLQETRTKLDQEAEARSKHREAIIKETEAIKDQMLVKQGRLTPTGAERRALERADVPGDLIEQRLNTSREARLFELQDKRSEDEARLVQRMREERAERERKRVEAEIARINKEYDERKAFEERRQDAIKQFAIEFTGARPSQFETDPISRALAQFRERISAGEFTQAIPGFRIGSERASAFQIGQRSQLAGLTIGQQSEESKILKDQLQVQKEAKRLLEVLISQFGVSGLGLAMANVGP